MRAIRPNDKVICIDATPIPIGAKGHDITDFTFPGGFISEGSIYCVGRVKVNLAPFSSSIQLVGKPVILQGEEVTWNSQRFRRINHKKRCVARKAKNSKSNTRITL